MRYVNCLIFSYVGAECSFLCRIFLSRLNDSRIQPQTP